MQICISAILVLIKFEEDDEAEEEKENFWIHIYGTKNEVKSKSFTINLLAFSNAFFVCLILLQFAFWHFGLLCMHKRAIISWFQLIFKCWQTVGIL
jgi:hypothetical protein